MRLRSLAVAAVVAGLALGLSACNAKPENSPVIRKKFAEQDQLARNVTDMQSTLQTISSDMKVLTDQISELRAMNPETANGSELIKRIESLENRLQGGSASDIAKASTSKPATVAPTTNPVAPATDKVAAASSMTNPTLAGTSPAPSNNIVASATSAGAPPVVQAGNANVAAVPATKPEVRKAETAKPAAKSAATTKEVAKPAVERKPAAPRITGKYYTVNTGDTLQSIASSNGVTVAQLIEANRLPGQIRVMKGQRLFIPSKK